VLCPLSDTHYTGRQLCILSPEPQDAWLADLAELDTAENRAAWMKGTTEEWGTESLLAARQAYPVPESAKMLEPGQKLAYAYLEANLPMVRRRLYLAGVRLAWVLNEAFPVK
jgi:hypothetical protein